MANWQLLGWLIGVPATLYGLHRLALWLEACGHLYYLNKRPSGSAAGAFVALQRAIDPSSQHVEQVHHEYHRVEEDDATGRGEGEPAE
jgi:hypothetical protein